MSGKLVQFSHTDIVYLHLVGSGGVLVSDPATVIHVLIHVCDFFCVSLACLCICACVSVCQVTEGVVNVIVYPSSTDKSKNRGFAFVEYESHKAAAMARRKLIPGILGLSVPLSV